MTTETGLGDDLTFIRSLLKERPVQLRTTGQLYGLAGMCYGLYALACGFALLGWSPLGDATFWIGTLASNGVFCVGVIVLSVRAKTPEGVANRALTGGFAGVGIANAVAALGFFLAQRTGLGAEVWILFPMVVAAFQGACWFLAALVTRRLWTAVIAAGWYLSVLVLALLISMVWAYMLVLGAVLLLLMALPGWILIRSASNP